MIWIRFETIFSEWQQLAFGRIIIGTMLYKTSKINLETFYLAVKAEKLIIS